jgi:hypothetical protein
VVFNVLCHDIQAARYRDSIRLTGSRVENGNRDCDDSNLNSGSLMIVLRRFTAADLRGDALLRFRLRLIF